MTNYDLDPNQLRAARALLGWDLKDLSARSGISESTLKNLERVGLGGQFATVRKVLKTYQDAGIEFPGRGVSLKTPSEERPLREPVRNWDNAIYNEACDIVDGRADCRRAFRHRLRAHGVGPLQDAASTARTDARHP